MDTLSLWQTSRTTSQHFSVGIGSRSHGDAHDQRSDRLPQILLRSGCCSVVFGAVSVRRLQGWSTFASDHTSFAGDPIIATRGLLFTTSLVQELLLLWAASGWWKANRFTSVP